MPALSFLSSIFIFLISGQLISDILECMFLHQICIGFVCCYLQLIAQAMPSRQTFFKALANGQEAMDDKVSTFVYFNYNNCVNSKSEYT